MVISDLAFEQILIGTLSDIEIPVPFKECMPDIDKQKRISFGYLERASKYERRK